MNIPVFIVAMIFNGCAMLMLMIHTDTRTEDDHWSLRIVRGKLSLPSRLWVQVIRVAPVINNQTPKMSSKNDLARQCRLVADISYLNCYIFNSDNVYCTDNTYYYHAICII